MKQFKTILIITACLLLNIAGYSHAQDFPLRPFKAQYTVEHDGNEIAITQLALKSTGNNQWAYQSTSEGTTWLARMLGAKVSEQSEFQWLNDIRISSYRYDRAGKEKHVHLLFDWPRMKVTNIINGDPWHMQIPEGTQDKLSINLALKTHLSRSQTDVSFPVADGGKLKTYDFKVIGKEIIDTPLGKISTIKLTRNKRGRKGKQAILWLAPDLNYLTIKMEKADKDNEIVTMKIQSLN